MKTIISILFFIAIHITVSASPLVEQADSAYTNDNFQEAVNLYNEILKTEGSSTTLYYNLGNSYYRLGQLGKAIVCYERALRLDPTNSDAHTNLEFVNSKIIDKPIDSGTFISNTIDSIVLTLHPNTWAWLALASFVLLLGCIALYLFSGNIPLKKSGFFGGIIMFIATIILIVFALKAAHKTTEHNTAIITAPSTILSTSPRAPKDRSEEAVLLHEGTKIEIVDSISSRSDSIPEKWYEVKIDNINRAWVNASQIEKI